MRTKLKTSLTRATRFVSRSSPRYQGRLTAEGMAPPERTVHMRTAEHDGHIYLDPADTHWRAVDIGSEGWRVIERLPVCFRRPPGMSAARRYSSALSRRTTSLSARLASAAPDRFRRNNAMAISLASVLVSASTLRVKRRSPLAS
jgi:hypothetical protein